MGPDLEWEQVRILPFEELHLLMAGEFNNNLLEKKAAEYGGLRAFELVCKPSEGWPSDETPRWGIWNLAFSFLGEHRSLDVQMPVKE